MADPLSVERIAEAADWIKALHPDMGDKMKRMSETYLAALALAERVGKAPVYGSLFPPDDDGQGFIRVADIVPSPSNGEGEINKPQQEKGK